MLARVASAISAAGSLATGVAKSRPIARVGAAEHDGEWLLSRAGTARRSCPVFHEAPIALAQARQRLLSRDHVEGLVRTVLPLPGAASAGERGTGPGRNRCR